MTKENLSQGRKKLFSFSMFLVTIGIVYGDIGTSPLYVMKSIIEGNGGIGNVNEDFIIGSLSLIIWTVTLLTTIKYVVIALKADNHGEGGIFSLYSLVRKCGKWLIFPAMIGGAALLADGVLTPAVTITTAVEGLRSLPAVDAFLGEGQTVVIAITLTIILILFLVQRAGTDKIGKAFGPVMLVWFSFLGICGIINITGNPAVLRAFNPLRAVKLLTSPYNLKGFMILGSIFLAATGAEALYSDVGHVGKENIYISWPFVKLCLIMNYLGQGAWITTNMANPDLLSISDLNPFFMMLPETFRPVAIMLSTAAAIIASQALITGSYTLVSEAILLDLMPHLKVEYPSNSKGQIYIGAVNTLLWLGCTCVVLYFRSSARIEAAYGLAITVTMLMTTLLLSVYLRKIQKKKILSVLVLLVFGAIEATFFISSLSKFTIGGYVTVVIALLILLVMIIWHRGTELENKYVIPKSISGFIDKFKDLKNDDTVPYTADNLVYIEAGSARGDDIDRDIVYSILDKGPKRAKAYWFISVEVMNEPYAMNYTVNTFGTDFIFRVRLELGFKLDQQINIYLRQIVQDLLASGEMPSQNKKYSINDETDVGNFRFVLVRKSVPARAAGLSKADSAILLSKYAIRRAAGSKVRWYGLDTSYLIQEYVPLMPSLPVPAGERIQRRFE